MEEKCIIVSAPSGSGKTTLVRALIEEVKALRFSVSATSRAPRHYESNGKDYYFLSPQAFRKKVDENAFLEWEEVYSDQFYGTLHSEVERIWTTGQNVIFDVDVVGGISLKKALGKKALAVFIKAPSIEVLEQRLHTRNTESSTSLKERVSKAEEEMRFQEKFDEVIVNDDLEKAKNELLQLVRKFLSE